MYYFLCKFLYVGDRSRFSANIPDEVGHLCIIKSDTNLDEIKHSILKQHYEIQELLSDNDCEDINLVEIIEEELNTEYYDLDVLVINKSDL